VNTNHVAGANVRPSMLPEAHSHANIQTLRQGRIVRQGSAVVRLYASYGAGMHAPKEAEPQTTQPAVRDRWRLSDSRLPINYVPKGCAPLEELVPRPDPRWQQELQEALVQDNWWKEDARGDESLLEYQKLVDERRRLGPDEEFRFGRLRPTLVNMQTFVRHIRANKQFPHPLTPGEDKAMAWVEKKTAELLAAEVPYKRTVHLAMAFMILCEIVTDRQVLGPLKKEKPALFNVYSENKIDKIKKWPEHLYTRTSSEAEGFSTARLDPEWVASLCWGGNNPGGEDEKTCLLTESYTMQHALQTLVENHEVVVFPTFAALSLEDFCRFSHLPVCPIGMITSYTLNADGQMMSPLLFFVHDLVHMGDLALVGKSGYESSTLAARVLCRPGQRLAWRRLLLDKTPACLASLKIDTACILLHFQLVHEYCPSVYAQDMDNIASCFLFFLKELAKPRREGWRGYEDIYRNLTDIQAATAALWATRLWQGWQATDFGQMKHEQLDACARRFVAEDLPRLKVHLGFVSLCRGRLRHEFIEWSEPGASSRSTPIGVRLTQELADGYSLTIFRTCDKQSDLRHLDNTDLAYFTALAFPDSRHKMIDRIRIPFPEVTLFAPEPVPGLEAKDTVPRYA